jgi:hypothetical protein
VNGKRRMYVGVVEELTEIVDVLARERMTSLDVGRPTSRGREIVGEERYGGCELIDKPSWLICATRISNPDEEEVVRKAHTTGISSPVRQRHPGGSSLRAGRQAAFEQDVDEP